MRCECAAGMLSRWYVVMAVQAGSVLHASSALQLMTMHCTLSAVYTSATRLLGELDAV